MIHAKKTNEPRVTCRSCGQETKAWFISVRYYISKGVRGVEKYAYGYKSEKDARLEAGLFRHTLESSSRIQKTKWIPFGKRTDDETTELLGKLTQIPKYVLVQCINSAGLLSIAELKAFRKNAKSNRLEHEFDTALDRTPQLREVFKNLFNSQYYTERETRCMKRSLALNSRRVRNINSGLGKWKRAYADQIRYVQKRKDLLLSRINLYQKAFEDLQISYTETKSG